MLTDREAEHIPGCNMAFSKRARRHRRLRSDLLEGWRRRGPRFGGCKQTGYKIGFSAPALSSGITAARPSVRISNNSAATAKNRKLAGAETSGVFQRIRQQHVARTDLCGVEIRYLCALGSANRSFITACSAARPSRRSTAQPALTLMLPTTLEYHFHHAAAVGAVGHVPLAAAGGQRQFVDLLRRSAPLRSHGPPTKRASAAGGHRVAS